MTLRPVWHGHWRQQLVCMHSSDPESSPLQEWLTSLWCLLWATWWTYVTCPFTAVFTPSLTSHSVWASLLVSSSRRNIGSLIPLLKHNALDQNVTCMPRVWWPITKQHKLMLQVLPSAAPWWSPWALNGSCSALIFCANFLCSSARNMHAHLHVLVRM